MANKKFSEFVLKTDTSGVSHIVGYNGAENVQITPANFVTTGGTGIFLPLAGGTMTGALVVDSTATVNDILTAGLGLALTGGTVGSGKLVLASSNKVHLSGGSAGLVLQNTGGTKSLTIDDTLSTFVGLVSGITPVDAANFVTKAYADGLTPGAGVFLPLAGGTLTGALIGTTATFGGNVSILQPATSAIPTLAIKSGPSGAGVLQIAGNNNALNTDSFDFVQNSAGAFINNRHNSPLSFSTNNSEKMKLDAAGNLGLGSSPSRKLDVRDASNTQSTLLAYNQGASFVGTVYEAITDRVGNSAFNLMNLKASTSSKFLVRGDGNVGIGTSTLLNVTSGRTVVTLGNTTSNFLNFSNASSTRFGGIYTDATQLVLLSDTFLKFETGNPVSEKMRLTAAGDLGLGTSTLTNSIGFSTLNISGSTGGQIAFQTGGTSKQFIFSNATDLAIYNAQAGNLLFYTSASERMRLISGGQLLIGTDSVSATLGTFCQLEVSDSTKGGIIINTETAAANNYSRLMFSINNNINGHEGLIRYNTSDYHMGFFTDASEKMRLDSSGNLLVGATDTVSSSKQYVKFGSGRGIGIEDTTGGTGTQVIWFRSGTTQVGNININPTSTAYSTSSDYRLKEDLQDFKGLDMVSKIPVYDYKWKADDSRSYGVMAHELEEVLPQAVTGDKDAEEMQSVDYSKIVPLLVKSIQELKAEIELLKK